MKTKMHPVEINPFGMLALTRWGDNLEFYVKADEITSIERLPAYTTVSNTPVSERTQLSLPWGVSLVNETPQEIFWRKETLDKQTAATNAKDTEQ